MALRSTALLLGSGGGAHGGTAFSNKSRFGNRKGFHSPRIRLQRFGVGQSRPHKAGFSSVPRWFTKTTMGHHQIEAPDYQRLNFKQHLDIHEERAQLVGKESFVPSLAKEQYEAWKTENVEEVKKHAGRYVVVEWTLQAVPGEVGSGGIVASYSPEDFATVHFSPSHTSWIDFVPVDFGTKEYTEEEKEALAQANEAWNDTRFPDIDQLKPWLNFSERDSWALSENKTPVSKRITAASGEAATEGAYAEPKDRPGLSKFLTYNCVYGYGTEQFEPWFTPYLETFKTQDHITGQRGRLQSKLRQQLGGHRAFVLDTKWTRRHGRREQTHFFNFTKSINKSFATLLWCDPAAREVHIQQGGKDKLLKFTKKRVSQRTMPQALTNMGSPSGQSHHYLHPDHWATQYKTFSHRDGNSFGGPKTFFKNGWSRSTGNGPHQNKLKA
eukprot:TRINITY_DN14741_c0_g1_i1.p1 TRINITY_DN14741_c0_g1~~TRINITY_DN14741_c0_g1_i1.p1  ORF type:complete len:440 (+),score=131.68 TRINITY_DN14741_c0_g1_i1:61-1380(+)